MELETAAAPLASRLSVLALKSTIGAFAGVVGLAVAAHVAAGTDWPAMRAEWDRFAAAFWRTPDAEPRTAAEQGASTAPHAASAPNSDDKTSSASVRTLQLPGLTIGDIKLPNVTLGSIRPGGSGDVAPSAPTRSYTIFDVVVADGLRIVTGHEFDVGASVASNAFCYGHAAESADGIEPHVTLARRKPGQTIEFQSITPRQSEALGRAATTVEAAARAHCKL